MIPLEYMDNIIWKKIDTECVKPYMEKTVGNILKEYEMTGELRIPEPKDDFNGNDFVKTICKKGTEWYQKSIFESFWSHRSSIFVIQFQNLISRVFERDKINYYLTRQKIPKYTPPPISSFNSWAKKFFSTLWNFDVFNTSIFNC